MGNLTVIDVSRKDEENGVILLSSNKEIATSEIKHATLLTVKRLVIKIY